LKIKNVIARLGKFKRLYLSVGTSGQRWGYT
jgi:hypothetical protein